MAFLDPNIQARKEMVESHLTEITGVSIEVTFVSETEMTFSYWSIDPHVKKVLMGLFKDQGTLRVDEDPELGTFIYLTLNPEPTH